MSIYDRVGSPTRLTVAATACGRCQETSSALICAMCEGLFGSTHAACRSTCASCRMLFDTMCVTISVFCRIVSNYYGSTLSPNFTDLIGVIPEQENRCHPLSQTISQMVGTPRLGTPHLPDTNACQSTCQSAIVRFFIPLMYSSPLNSEQAY